MCPFLIILLGIIIHGFYFWVIVKIYEDRSEQNHVWLYDCMDWMVLQYMSLSISMYKCNSIIYGQNIGRVRENKLEL